LRLFDCHSPSKFNPFDAIHEQDGDGRTTDSGLPLDLSRLLREVIFPYLAPRVEEFYNGVCRWINSRQIGAFVQVAVMACQRKIGVVISTAMLLRTDVLDMEWKD
jgi:hypothetical protein